MFEQLTDDELNQLRGRVYRGRERIYNTPWPIGSKTVYTRMAMDATRLIDEFWGIWASRQWKDKP